MQRYLTRPSAVYYDYNVGQVLTPESVNVHELDNKPVDTGLLDASGQKLFRVTEREPIGFVIGKR